MYEKTRLFTARTTQSVFNTSNSLYKKHSYKPIIQSTYRKIVND